MYEEIIIKFKTNTNPLVDDKAVNIRWDWAEEYRRDLISRINNLHSLVSDYKKKVNEYSKKIQEYEQKIKELESELSGPDESF